MIVVLDTNVVLQSRSPLHEFHRILQAWKDRAFTLAVSTAKTGATRWASFAAFIRAVALTEDNLIVASPTFHFHLITAAPDDDKFADCAIAAEADYIITEDSHFDVLKTSGHKPQPISPTEFIARFLA